MLEFRTKINNAESARHYDENGFMTVDSPILNEDVLEYMGYELLGGKSPNDVMARDIAGITVHPDKVYKVRIPHEELVKSAETFKLLPLVDGHEWLNGGKEDADAKDYQEGSTGENVRVEDGKLFVPLKFTGKGILSHLDKGVEELSASYEHNLMPDVTGEADFIATDIVGNHVALVERGRCGSEIRVYNSNNGVEMKSNNEIALLLDGKKIDLAQFFEQEAEEQEHEGTDAIVPADNEEVDKRKIIDDIGGMLKDKGLDDEDIRTVIGMAEKLAYDDSTAGTADNKCSNEDEVEEVEEKEEDEEKIETENSASAIAALRDEMAKAAKEAHKAYNEAVALIGEDFNAVGLSAKDIYAHALKERGIKTENKSLAEMKAMAETLRSVRVDNAFTPAMSTSAEDEVEINV